MGRLKENPRYSVLSVRITDQAADMLKEEATRKGVNISGLLRDLLEAYTEVPA